MYLKKKIEWFLNVYNNPTLTTKNFKLKNVYCERAFYESSVVKGNY
jgi:hypothetical protein